LSIRIHFDFFKIAVILPIYPEVAYISGSWINSQAC